MLPFISFGVSGPLLSPERSDYKSQRPDSVLTHFCTQRNILRWGGWGGDCCFLAEMGEERGAKLLLQESGGQ